MDSVDIVDLVDGGMLRWRRRLLAGLFVMSAIVAGGAGTAHAESVRRQAVEADLLLAFGEHLGSTPLVIPGAGLEFGLGHRFGLLLSGHAVVAPRKTLSFLEETGTGGGPNLALRFYVRGGWPRAFGIGVAASLLHVDGVGIATPRAEIFYRFIVLSHLSVRIQGVVGGVFLWDTAPCDDRPGPGWRNGENRGCPGQELPPEVSRESNSVNGILIGVGLSIGWVSVSN